MDKDRVDLEEGGKVEEERVTDIAEVSKDINNLAVTWPRRALWILPHDARLYQVRV